MKKKNAGRNAICICVCMSFLNTLIIKGKRALLQIKS